MTQRLLFAGLLLAFAFLLVPFTGYLKERPVAVKLGSIPEPEVLRALTGEHRTLTAELAVVKVLFYFGTLIEQQRKQVVIRPEYGNMFKMLATATKLDPYNMDVYYFSQAAFTWELGKAADVNRMLEYGMKFRTWDHQLPFFAGFNAAYFLKDYSTAARHLQRAAQLSGNPLYANLAARYFYEAGQSELGLLFLDTLAKDERDRNVRYVYDLRRKALLAIRFIEGGIARFRQQFNRMPADLRELEAHGVINRLPTDPYGGTFYLDQNGRVRSTSKFAIATGGGSEGGRDTKPPTNER